MKIKKQLSRKQLRKQKKLQKKQKTRQYHQSKSFKNTLKSHPTAVTQANKISKQNKQQQNVNKHQSTIQAKIKSHNNINKKEKKFNKVQQQLDSQDQRIAMYEQKLGIKGKNKKYGSIAKKMGFDDDLFNFLDNISKKVKTDNYQYQIQQQQYQDQDQDQNEQEKGEREEYDQDIQNDMQDQDQYQQQNDQLMNQAMEQFDNLQNQNYENYDEQDQEQMDQQQEEEQQQVIYQPKKKIQQQKLNKKQQKKNKNNKITKQQIHQPQNKTKSKNKQKIDQKLKKSPQQPQKLIQKPTIQNKLQKSQIQQQQIHKKMNSLFNKLSDGNLLITFRQFISIIYNYPKSITYKIFSILFNKFNLMIQKPLIHVISANIIIAVSLHRVFGDKFMAQILYQITQNFQKLYKQQQNLQEIQEIGYSKLFQKKKNYITIICFLYQFGSISASFPQSLVSYLSQNISNKQNIQLIYQILQKCGPRMRANDPGTLKQVIQILKKMIDQSKKNGTFQTTKIKFIQIQINQIRFNKKGLFDADQRMGFLHTFLSKTIKQQAPVQIRTIDATFDQFRKILDTTKPQFWLEESKQISNNIQQENDSKNKQKQPNQQVKALIQLSKSMHFVTQIKRNIFVQLMSSQDYIQATKKILDLRVKRLQDICTVLVEVNLQQNMFNPFYSLVACKIAEEIPKFRVCLQFSIWDRLKQLQSFDIRKISNLGKFTAWLISSPTANSSLSILKYFPDLLNLKSEEDIFIQVFFKQFLRKSQRNWVTKLAHKLKQQKNKVIRDGIKDYLGELLSNIQSQKQKQNAVLLRKLLAIQFQTQIQND